MFKLEGNKDLGSVSTLLIQAGRCTERVSQELVLTTPAELALVELDFGIPRFCKS